VGQNLPFSRGLAETPGFRRSRDERKKVEMAFAHMKRNFKLDRLRLRGLSGARVEVLLTATAQNFSHRHASRQVDTHEKNKMIRQKTISRNGICQKRE